MTDSTVEILALGPGTLPRLIWALARRRRVYTVGLAPGWPVLRLPFGQLASWLERKNLCAPATKLFPREERYFVDSWMPEYPDLFWRIESDMRRRFRFAAFESLPDYAQALRHAVCQYTSFRLRQVSMLRRLGKTASVHGLDGCVLAWHGLYFGAAPKATVRSRAGRDALANAMTALAMAGFAVGWAVRRLILRRPPPQPVLIGFDFVRDERSMALLDGILDDRRDALMVFRNREHQTVAREWKALEGVSGYYPEDVRLTPAEAAEAIGLIARDVTKLFKACGTLPADLFFEMAKLPFRRAVFRLMLRRRPMRAFLSRDDYNSEHAVRSVELRRAGVLSLGIAHGLMTPGIVDPQIRHIDFDVYLTFGRYPFPEHYVGHTWPSAMKMRAVGSLGFGPAHFRRARANRSKDIAFFISRLVGEQEFYEQALILARALPDRRVFVKAKYRPTSVYHVDFRRDNEPENLEHTWEDSYDLILRCGYAVSNGSSSVAAEAIQAGVTAFVWDSFPDHMPFFYRHFPELCVRDAGAIVDRIRSREAGIQEPSKSAFDELIDLSQRPIADVIREIVQLPARTAAPSTAA